MATMIHSALGESEGVETPYPQSPWVVMKFGGSSVATAENWQRIAHLLEERLREGVRPFVCHSALQGVSNGLVELMNSAVKGGSVDDQLARLQQQHADLAIQLGISEDFAGGLFDTLRQLVVGVQLVGEVSPRVHARIMATGELVATRLGAKYLETRGLPVQWHDATRLLQAEVDPDQTEKAGFLSARCDYEPDPKLQRLLAGSDDIVLTQGFIARNRKNEVVLLGRGGSDTSGAYFAGKLQARRLEIWTDVPGFFSADPRGVPSARLIRRLQYREAQEISSAGGGILHPRSISPVRESRIPLFLKSTLHPEWLGTVISDAVGEDSPQLKAISQRGGITLISMESLDMWHQVGFLAKAFECFRSHGISVDLISTSESNVTVSIDVGANVTDRTAVEALATDLEKLCKVTVINDCAAITLVGSRIRTILHDLAPVLEVFEEYRIHLLTQAANDLNLTFVVSSEHAHRLVQHIHGLLVERFHGGIFGSTWQQLAEAAPRPEALELPWWAAKRSELLRIAERMGAAYVYDRETIAAAIAELKSLKNADAIFYAMKANSHPEILQQVYNSGLNLECVSPGEIKRVRDAVPDVEAGRMLFTPNFAPREEYEWALRQGIRLTLDNLYPLRHWATIFRDKEVLIRVDTGHGRGHHEHVRTAGAHSKFGVPLSECDELVDLIASCGAKVVGLHAHTGSGILDPDAWRRTGERLGALAGRFPDLRYLDLGGGMGVPEKPGQLPLDMAALDAGLGVVKAALPDLQIWLEPGRYLVAPAGVLLARVTQTKGKGELRYLGINTGMNSLIRPALYGAFHEIVNLSRFDDAATVLTTVVGPICETGDRLGSDRLMPAAEEGDVLLIANTGAYGYVMSSNYNLRPPATEVMI